MHVGKTNDECTPETMILISFIVFCSSLMSDKGIVIKFWVAGERMKRKKEIGAYDGFLAMVINSLTSH